MGTVLWVLLAAVCLGAVYFLTAFDEKCFSNRETDRVYRRYAAYAGAGLSAGVLFVLHAILMGSLRIDRTLAGLITHSVTYQQAAVLPAAVLWGMVILPVSGIVSRGYIARRAGADDIRLPMSLTRKCMLMAIMGVLALSVAALMGFAYGGADKILLNEVCAKNEDAGLNGGLDYIELRNGGVLPYAIGAGEMFLTDDEENLRKLPLDEKVIAPGETLLVSLAAEANFSLGKSGGDRVLLTDKSGRVIDDVRLNTREGQRTYSRALSDGKWTYMQATPGTNNAAQPVLSVRSGFYSGEFMVEIASADGYDIYYTTDGSVPTAASEKYTAPVRVYDRSGEENIYRAIPNVTYDWLEVDLETDPVAKCFVLQAVAVGPEGQMSEIATASYFVDSAEDQKYVVALTADPEAVFGPQGIYSTGEAYDEWYLGGGEGEQPQPNFQIHGLECPVNIEMFVDGELYFAQTGGLRVQGGSHRTQPLKRLSVFARTKYTGDKMFEEEIFAGSRTHSVALRAGFLNAFSMYVAKDRDVTVQRSVPVAVYLNGEYWYDTYMQEKYSPAYFEAQYGVTQVEYLKTSLTDDMNRFLQSHDLAKDADYAAFGELVDIQSYIDYTCINLYLANTDDAERGNAAVWRTKYPQDDGFGDGRWRWCLYDMDLITTYYRKETGQTDITDAQVNSFREVRKWSVPLNERILFTNLMKNDQFRKQFVLTLMDMINTNFSVPAMTELLEDWGEDIEYNDSFFVHRAGYITAYMAEELGLTGTQQTVRIATNDASGGRVQVNTAMIPWQDGAWEGKYFTDYPITVTAVANDGYVFVGWQGAAETSDAQIEVAICEGGVELIAVFEKCD